MATHATPPGKRDFAKRAFSFADRALPGFPAMWVIGAAATALAIVTGPFATATMPFGQRTAFWLLLMGWSLVKWQLWFWAMVRRPADWRRAALIGTIVVNLPLPLEIALALRAVGVERMPALSTTWLAALAISAIIFAVLLVANRPAKPAAPPQADGPLARARINPAELAAITSEDHYCRFHRRDGGSVLVHARLADALADVATLDGEQTHRGAWVAAGAVAEAERDGRRWRLVLADGTRLPVSSSYAPNIRARGWLARG